MTAPGATESCGRWQWQGIWRRHLSLHTNVSEQAMPCCVQGDDLIMTDEAVTSIFKLQLQIFDLSY